MIETAACPPQMAQDISTPRVPSRVSRLFLAPFRTLSDNSGQTWWARFRELSPWAIAPANPKILGIRYLLDRSDDCNITPGLLDGLS